jgi:uncharacterized membrane protein
MRRSADKIAAARLARGQAVRTERKEWIMRLNHTLKGMLLAGVLVAPALAQQATPDPAPGRTVPERVAPAVPATPAMPSQAMPSERPSNAVAAATGARASKLIGASVSNAENETIGKIDDLIITADERVPVAVLSVGGFLGIGAKLVSVPFERLTINADGKVMLPGATRDSLKALPEFKYPS